MKRSRSHVGASQARATVGVVSDPVVAIGTSATYAALPTDQDDGALYRVTPTGCLYRWHDTLSLWLPEEWGESGDVSYVQGSGNDCKILDGDTIAACEARGWDKSVYTTDVADGAGNAYLELDATSARSGMSFDFDSGELDNSVGILIKWAPVAGSAKVGEVYLSNGKLAILSLGPARATGWLNSSGAQFAGSQSLTPGADFEATFAAWQTDRSGNNAHIFLGEEAGSVEVADTLFNTGPSYDTVWIQTPVSETGDHFRLKEFHLLKFEAPSEGLRGH